MDPVSPSDPGLPPAVRAAIAGMQPGELSPILATERGYTMMLMEDKSAGKGEPKAEDRARVEARVRARKERIAMDRLARQLLGTAKVTVLDSALHWSWEARPR
jgi:hypothetical protein